MTVQEAKHRCTKLFYLIWTELSPIPGEGITKSVQYALEKVGKPEPDLQKLRIFVGPPLFGAVSGNAGIYEETARKAVEIYRERYAPVGIYENELYPGIGNVIRTETKRIQACHCVFQTREFREDRCGIFPY